MKNYFVKLNKYDLWANNLVIKAMTDIGEPKSIKFMGHLLAAQ